MATFAYPAPAWAPGAYPQQEQGAAATFVYLSHHVCSSCTCVGARCLSPTRTGRSRHVCFSQPPRLLILCLSSTRTECSRHVCFSQPPRLLLLNLNGRAPVWAAGAYPQPVWGAAATLTDPSATSACPPVWVPGTYPQPEWGAAATFTDPSAASAYPPVWAPGAYHQPE